MAREYPWYEIIEGDEELLQGDFVSDCPILIPTTEVLTKADVEVNVATYNVVIMSQSCDLVQKKLELVLVCPIWLLKEIEALNLTYQSREWKEGLRNGYVPGYHLLNKCDVSGFESGFKVVDFRSIYSLPFEFLTDLAKSKGKRLRLCPPYREHLSQAFSRFFMRVGLPMDIPPFK